MTGTPTCEATSAIRLVRNLMLRAGLDQQSAARELEIDETTMQRYASGEEVPRRIVFALMRLADMGPRLRRN